MAKKIVVAGGTGNLGSQICDYLVSKGASVHILARPKSETKLITNRKEITVHKVSFQDSEKLAKVLQSASCIVSALSGLREVVIDAQTQLLEAAINARVPKFIPSDYCIDYRPIKHGTNRNLDLRREFSTALDSSSIKATSILNGMFTDLLKDEAPIILRRPKRIFFWGDGNQKMDFTSIDNTAEVTAEAALDETSPRWLRVAGEEASMHDIAKTAGSVYGGKFKFLRPGGLQAFQLVINVTKTFAPGKNEVFPAWQGMQYLHDMLTGLPKHKQLDNIRYPGIEWSSIKSVLQNDVSER